MSSSTLPDYELMGDVGVLSRGGFTTLFNAMDAEAAVEQEQGGDGDGDSPFPDDFQPFRPNNLVTWEGTGTALNQPFLCSRGIEEAAVNAHADSISMHAKWTDLSGAVLALALPTYTRRIESKRAIAMYLKQHYASWVALATRMDLDVSTNDVVFVSGTTTTTACGVLAYCSPGEGEAGAGESNLNVSFEEREGAIRAELDGAPIPADRTCSYSVERGPGGRGLSGHSEGRMGGALCVFVHYYKMKRRLWWWRAMQAGAGPHELPRGPDDEGASSCSSGSQCGAERGDERYSMRYDPVDGLLNYILENSAAHCAIASTHDACELLQPADVWFRRARRSCRGAEACSTAR
ncbi:hypothetical protein OH76DRAFT_1010472 [Lentinus brumalis]|uniref:Uncharacterized protein n=1 Tax=Lentinus brumalis TaxID=2498619 RepID=A0A371CYC4_9APHY|nr:hypothetical protein OH76DRAFT_1010472 [Polyporus brumalis]